MMAQLISEISHLVTPAGFFALVNVILIDIVLSGDNAIVIGMAVKDLKGKKRRQTIVLGIVMATLMRIMFASVAVLMLRIMGLKFAGGLLLLYVVWKFYKELRTEKEQEGEAQARQATTMLSAIILIMIADFSMSLDNVLAVAGAAKESLLILAIGLMFSITLMAVASNYIASKMDKYPMIQWVGLLVILFVAIEMLLTGGKELDERLLHVNILPAASIILGALGCFLHAKYVEPANDEKIAAWFSSNWRGIFIANLLMILSLCFLGDKIKNFMLKHPPALYFILAIVLFILIEIIATFRAGRKSKNNGDK